MPFMISTCVWSNDMKHKVWVIFNFPTTGNMKIPVQKYSPKICNLFLWCQKEHVTFLGLIFRTLFFLVCNSSIKLLINKQLSTSVLFSFQAKLKGRKTCRSTHRILDRMFRNHKTRKAVWKFVCFFSKFKMIWKGESFVVFTIHKVKQEAEDNCECDVQRAPLHARREHARDGMWWDRLGHPRWETWNHDVPNKSHFALVYSGLDLAPPRFCPAKLSLRAQSTKCCCPLLSLALLRCLLLQCLPCFLSSPKTPDWALACFQACLPLTSQRMSIAPDHVQLFFQTSLLLRTGLAGQEG